VKSHHLDWPLLNDYADGTLAPAASAVAARHIDECAECRETLSRLRSVMGSAAAARTIDPPESAWDAVRGEIEQRKVVALGTPHAGGGGRSMFRMATAAVALIAASSLVTALVMRRGEAPATPVASATGGADAQLLALPGSMRNAERAYLATVDELTAVLDESRERLAPETVRALERSLAIIDEAIAEAREALLHDPANQLVRDLLRKGYEQKVDLLRRTASKFLQT